MVRSFWQAIAVAETDFTATRSKTEIRSLMSDLIGSFIKTFILKTPKSQFEQLLDNQAIEIKAICSLKPFMKTINDKRLMTSNICN